MMLLRARDDNIQSFAYIWLNKENQNEFLDLKHSKIKLVRLAQVVEQWTGYPVVGGSCSPSNHLIFGCLRNSFRFPLSSQVYAKL